MELKEIKVKKIRELRNENKKIRLYITRLSQTQTMEKY